MDRKGMSEVMDARSGIFVVCNFTFSEQKVECPIDSTLMQAPGSIINKEGGVRVIWFDFGASAQVLFQRRACRNTQGDPSGLSELAFSYIKAPVGAMEMLKIQGQCFSNTDSRTE